MVYYVHSDQLNTPRQVTRPSDNAQMWTWFSDPFGTDAANSNPVGAGTFTYNIRFAGQIFDGQAGLHQNGFRDYDPASGRYVESDPIGLKGGNNTFGYANGRPILTIDPRGLLSLTVAASWSTVDSIDGALATTEATLRNVHCACQQGCGGQWRLSECTAFLYIAVTMQYHYSSPEKEAFARHGEEEHVQDWKNGAAEIRLRGEVAEQAQRHKTFLTKAICESESQAQVGQAMYEAWYDTLQHTLDRDTSGSHTYYGK